MLAVRQFRAGFDNLSYLVYGRRQALAIDGVAADEILAFARERDLTLAFVANTHSHFDHTGGNGELARQPGARVLSFRDLAARGSMRVEDDTVAVIPTPGHTYDSLCFHVDGTLVTGDTLFNGTVGNCFTGDWEGFFASLRRLMQFPPATVVYAGHDYVRDSLLFAKGIEPDNAALDVFLARYDPGHVRSTLAEELRINPFLRFDDEGIVAALARRNLPRRTSFERWKSLMTMD